MLDQIDELAASGWCLFSTITGAIAPGQIHESAEKAHTALALMGDGAPYGVGPIFTRDAIATLERCGTCDGNGVCQMCEASGSPCECAGRGCLVCGGDGRGLRSAAETLALRAAARTWLFLWDDREAKVVKAVPPNPPTTEQLAMGAIRTALAPPPESPSGSGYFCAEGHEVHENTSYCAMCQTGVISMTREAWERTANTYLEHFSKKHPRPEDGICERCVDIARAGVEAETERWKTAANESIGIYQTAPGVTELTRAMYEGGVNALTELLKNVSGEAE